MESHKVAGKGCVFTKNSQMTAIGTIFSSTCHTKQLNPRTNSSTCHVVIPSRLFACQRKIGPFEGHLSTYGDQTGLRKRPERKQTVPLSAVLNTYPVGALIQLTDGIEKCVLKLCVYKTPFGKSDHIYKHWSGENQSRWTGSASSVSSMYIDNYVTVDLEIFLRKILLRSHM